MYTYKNIIIEKGEPDLKWENPIFVFQEGIGRSGKAIARYNEKFEIVADITMYEPVAGLFPAIIFNPEKQLLITIGLYDEPNIDSSIQALPRVDNDENRLSKFISRKRNKFT